MRTLEGAIYTVDEVSDLLGIPRPTLYRYLREYSIPHLRRSGRISIPEDSFDRIRGARDLHKEGLGTESVRRQLREGSGPDVGELDRRLDHLRETLEGLRGDLQGKPTSDEVALSPALRTILARQSLLISAMFNLTGMVEDLLLANGKPRKPLFENLIAETREPFLGNQAPDRLAIQPAQAAPVSATVADPPPRSTLRSGIARFGALRRRRWGVLAILSVLFVGLCLVWVLPALIGPGEPETPASKAPPASEESSGKAPPEPEGAKATPAETTSPEDTTMQASRKKGDLQVAAAGSEPEAGVRVPDVSDKGLEEAAGTVSDAGLEVAVVRTEASQQEPGTVIGTVPAAGNLAEQGTPVTLRISIGASDPPPSVPPASSPSAQSTN
ncbi:MAG: PASTA domain-containing protein [Rubrobacter sp.]